MNRFICLCIYITLTGKTYTRFNLSRNDGGTYVCDADNGIHGQDPPDSQAVEVIVQCEYT